MVEYNGVLSYSGKDPGADTCYDEDGTLSERNQRKRSQCMILFVRNVQKGKSVEAESGLVVGWMKTEE